VAPVCPFNQKHSSAFIYKIIDVLEFCLAVFFCFFFMVLHYMERRENVHWLCFAQDGSSKALKGTVHPKIKNYIIIFSRSCRSKPVRHSFIFRTQIKIFLMKSERFLPAYVYKEIVKQIIFWRDSLALYDEQIEFRLFTYKHWSANKQKLNWTCLTCENKPLVKVKRAA